MDADNLDISLLEEIEAHAISSAREAGQILLEHFSQPLEVQFKDKKRTDPVTTADRRSEEFLKSTIREKFPQHGILGEEGGALHKSDSPFVWVIDPLDGTSNFMNGLPLFAVSIGVLWKWQPVVGSIYVPVSHRGTAGVYHACQGKGSHLDGEKITVTRKPSGRPLSGNPSQFRSRFRLSRQSQREPHEARNLGSIALELTLAACGVFQYALFGSPKVWDVAAGVLLVKEAGGLAFTRRPKVRNWLPLERFQSEQSNSKETLENLRSWSSPVIVGAPEITRKVVQDIRSPHAPLSWLTALQQHQSQKDGK
ncbi:MAG: inositol monophosphatase [Chloroflexi bacterium]|nr:inositol monophosphatase [Chloroflexota bacterium]